MVPVDMMEAGAERRPGLRPAHRVNYKKLSELKLPKASRSRPSTVDQEHLYPVEIVEEDSLRYKVHYVGYSRSFDEWKSKEEIVALGEDADEDTGGVELVPNSERFMLYNELAIRIKTSLNSHRKLSPVVRIDMPFDRIEFDGGLRISGKEKRSIHGVQRYTIAQFQDLNRLLGVNWHFRGINANGDFCYVIRNTVEYYLYHRRPLKEFMPSTEGSSPIKLRDTGYMLVFTFVRGDGTSDKFGTDPQIFVN